MPLYGGPQRPSPFLDHHPQVLRGHPVLGQPFGDLRIGVMFEEDPFRRAEFLDGAGRTGRHGEQAGDVVQLFVRVRQMGIDAGGIQDENDLA